MAYFNIVKIDNGVKTIKDNIPTSQDALLWFQTNFDPADIFICEEDSDNPGCYDILTKSLDQYAINIVNEYKS